MAYREVAFPDEFVISLQVSRDELPISLSKSEMGEYVKRFNTLDKDRKGFVTVNDIRQSLKVR